MYADTVGAIEVKRGEVDKRTINFGLVERPKSKLSISKKIAGIKIANQERVLVDTENEEVANAQLVEDGSWAGIELDDLVLNGATIEVKYKIKNTFEHFDHVRRVTVMACLYIRTNRGMIVYPYVIVW